MKSYVVFCGASKGDDPVYTDEAYLFGRLLAQSGIQIIYGGASIGVMGALAEGCLQHGGKVVGIIPRFFVTKEVAHDQLSEMIVVNTMHERKLMMYRMAHGVIALPGGFGTMDELFEILTWSQLGMHQMPIALLNTKGYFDHLLAFVKHTHREGFIHHNDQDLLLSDPDPKKLLDKMDAYSALPRKVWIGLDEL